MWRESLQRSSGGGAAAQRGAPALFERVRQYYALANEEDYRKNGQWQLDLLRIDLQLLEAHRRHAGLPDLEAEDEVDAVDANDGDGEMEEVLLEPEPKPEVKRLPTSKTAARPVYRPLGTMPPASSPRSTPAPAAWVRYTPASASSIRSGPALAATSIRSAPAAPAASTRPTFTPMRSAPSAASSSSFPLSSALMARRGVRSGPYNGAAKVQGAPAAKNGTAKAKAAAKLPKTALAEQLEKIQNFIDTWGLDPPETKRCLAKLPAPQRRWLLETYDGSEPLEDFLRAGSDEKSPAPAVATAIAGPGEAPGELIKNMLQ